MTTRKIAILKTKDVYYNYGDDRETIATSITDWSEVTHEEYVALCNMGARKNFLVLERPIDEPAFIAQTVADYIKMMKDEAEKEAERKKAAEEAALARKIKKEAKTKQQKLEMLKKLQEELGVEGK
jgi:sorbitol-specific phosphotransferase system component IIBC